MPGSQDDAMLFVTVYACGSAAEARIAALPHLDEDKRFPVLHDEVDLAKAAAVIHRNRLQSLPLQEFRRPALRLLAVQGLMGVDSTGAASSTEDAASTPEAFLV